MDRSAIEWTDATWNPIRGCTRVSEGCRNCYAESVAARFSGPGQPYEGLAHHVERNGKSEARWTGKIAFVEKALDQPLRWKTPRRIFVNSMSDLFHEGVTDAQLDQIFAVMALAPQHTFQVLTKRPERMREYLRTRADDLGSHWPNAARKAGALLGDMAAIKATRLPLPNVWLGVSVEDQATADERIPLLLDTPAAVRWISAEPLLGPVDLTRLDYGVGVIDSLAGYYYGLGVPIEAEHRRLDWVVVGGESGSGARPMHPDCARALRDQCAAAGVAFLFKQWGGWHPMGQILANGNFNAMDKGERHGVWDDETQSVRVGKSRAGRLLDGVLHDGYPQVTA